MKTYEVDVYPNGYKAWYLNGEWVSEEEFNNRMMSSSSCCSGKIVEIEGKRYKLVEV